MAAETVTFNGDETADRDLLADASADKMKLLEAIAKPREFGSEFGRAGCPQPAAARVYPRYLCFIV